MEFVFGIEANRSFVREADKIGEAQWQKLERLLQRSSSVIGQDPRFLVTGEAHNVCQPSRFSESNVKSSKLRESGGLTNALNIGRSVGLSQWTD